jgi:hypothetical protein
MGKTFRFRVGDNIEAFDCGGFHGIGIVKALHEDGDNVVYDVVFHDKVRDKIVEDLFLEHDLHPPRYKVPVGYWLHEFEDETSMYDPKGRWLGGCEYYVCTCKIWVPDSIGKDDEDKINEYIEAQQGIPDMWAD